MEMYKTFFDTTYVDERRRGQSKATTLTSKTDHVLCPPTLTQKARSATVRPASSVSTASVSALESVATTSSGSAMIWYLRWQGRGPAGKCRR